MRPVPEHFYTQSGVVAMREKGGETQVMLVTSRRGTRWIIPKGVVEEGLSPSASAGKEAWEEAGIRGTLDDKPLGSYEYEKWGGTCRVEVYAMAVAEQSGSWPEKDLRDRRWVKAAEAAAMVREKELGRLIRIAAGRERKR